MRVVEFIWHEDKSQSIGGGDRGENQQDGAKEQGRMEEEHQKDLSIYENTTLEYIILQDS